MNNNFGEQISPETEKILKSKGIDPNTIKSDDAKNLMNSLNKEDKEKINQLLNDKQALETFLSSEKAKQIMKNLFGKK